MRKRSMRLNSRHDSKRGEAEGEEEEVEEEEEGGSSGRGRRMWRRGRPL